MRFDACDEEIGRRSIGIKNFGIVIMTLAAILCARVFFV